MDTHVLRAIQLLVACARKTNDGGVFGKERMSRRAGIVCFKVRSEMVEEVDVGSGGTESPVLTNGNGNRSGSVSPAAGRISRTWSRESLRGKGLNMTASTSSAR